MAENIIPSNPADRRKLRGMIEEIDNALTRMDAERDAIKDIVNEAADQFDVDKKYVRKLARILHKQNFSAVKDEADEVEALYEAVIEEKKT